MPQGDLFISKVFARIGGPGIIPRAPSSVLPCLFTGDAPELPRAPGALVM